MFRFSLRSAILGLFLVGCTIGLVLRSDAWFLVAVTEQEGRISDLQYAPDGTSLACCSCREESSSDKDTWKYGRWVALLVVREPHTGVERFRVRELIPSHVVALMRARYSSTCRWVTCTWHELNRHTPDGRMQWVVAAADGLRPSLGEDIVWPVSCVDIAPDDKRFAIANEDQIFLCELGVGCKADLRTVNKSEIRLKFSSLGDRLLAYVESKNQIINPYLMGSAKEPNTEKDGLYLFNTDTSSENAYTYRRIGRRACFSPDGNYAAVFLSFGTIIIEVATSRALFKLPSVTSPEIQFSRDNRLVALGRKLYRLDEENAATEPVFCADGVVDVLQQPRQKLEELSVHPRHAQTVPEGIVDFCNSGRYILFEKDETGSSKLGIWDIENNRLHQELEGTWDCLSEPRFSRSGELVIDTGCGLVWSACDGNLLVKGSDELVVNPDESKGVCLEWDSVTFEGSVTLFDLRSGVCLFRFPSAEVTCADFHHNDWELAIGDRNGRIAIWKKRRPEYWWGLLWLPESWMAMLLLPLIVWSIRRDRSVARLP